MENDIMVSVICGTYNHEAYIRDCIEGVVRQKANFKFEMIIHDDASTDRTAEIIREYEKRYPSVIKPVYQKENQFSRCNISKKFLYPLARGKYMAFCDGDDYWTDEGKLQKQVDFLESHEDYSLCMHNAVKKNCETGEERLLDTFPKDGTYSQSQQILAGLGTDFPAFSSVMVRAGALEDIPDFFFDSNVMDYPIRQYYANRGKAYYFQKPMSVYRAATPQSYMRQTARQQSFYNNYTLEMIRFFENFDRYTEGRFSHLLEQKIVSDYFGYCLSIAEEEGLRKASERGLEIGTVKEIYRKLSPSYLDENVRKLCDGSDAVFIYGTSRLAPICKRQLEQAGILFEGFVVSDNQMKADSMEGRNVHYLSDAVKNFQNPGFILAVQPVNAAAIANALQERGIERYCAPYFLKNKEQ